MYLLIRNDDGHPIVIEVFHNYNKIIEAKEKLGGWRMGYFIYENERFD